SDGSSAEATFSTVGAAPSAASTTSRSNRTGKGAKRSAGAVAQLQGEEAGNEYQTDEVIVEDRSCQIAARGRRIGAHAEVDRVGEHPQQGEADRDRHQHQRKDVPASRLAAAQDPDPTTP